MSTGILAIMLIFPLTSSQIIEVQNLDHNNRYITIKLEDKKIIENFQKIMHIINITEYESAKNLIRENIRTIEKRAHLIQPIFNTIMHNFNTLERKIYNLKPHKRQTRGLMNIMGTGLKYIAGTMDHNDEEEIKNKIETLSRNTKNLIEENNKQVLINNEISDQIKNLTRQIKIQQNIISKFLNKFTQENGNKILQIEEEIEYMQYVYQLNYDITLFKNHMDDIEQVILTSK